MKIRNKELVPVWAESPEAFALEPQHVQDEYRGQVEALRAKNEQKAKREARKSKETDYNEEE